MSNFDTQVNLQHEVAVVGGFIIYRTLDTGKRVKATATEWFCYNKGDEGEIVGVDNEGSIAVKFDKSGQTWFVTRDVGIENVGEHVIELIEEE